MLMPPKRSKRCRKPHHGSPCSASCFAPDFPCPKRNYLHFNTVILMHRMPPHIGPWSGRLGCSPLCGRPPFLRLNQSLAVSGGEETKHIGADDVSRPVRIFLARTTAAHDSCVLILNIDRFRSSPAVRGVSVLPFPWANPNPPSLSATSELARHQM